MDFSIKTGQPEKLKTNCLVLAIFEAGELPETSARIDHITDGYINKVIKLGDIQGKLGQTLMLHNVPNIHVDRILLVGCGKSNEFNNLHYREAIQHMASTLKNYSVREVVCCITELNVQGYDVSWKG